MVTSPGMSTLEIIKMIPQWHLITSCVGERRSATGRYPKDYLETFLLHVTATTIKQSCKGSQILDHGLTTRIGIHVAIVQCKDL